MPNVYKPGLLQIRPQYTTDPDSGDTPENVLWFQSATTTTPTLANLTAIQTQFDTLWSECWKGIGTSSADYTGSIVTDWSSASGLQVSSVGSFTPVPGTEGTAAPPQVAILISYQIQLRWRGGHFRTYLPWVGMSSLTGTYNDKMDPTVQAALVASVQSMITDMKTTGVLGGQTLVMYKDKTNPATAQTYDVATFTVSNLVATQRRRVRHVGRR